MKLTDESGRVVACYTYGTYGELLSGDTTLTSFLYNGRCGVSTDDNGLYYMRQRYYNPEIKRFVNQDILAGSLSNSQSLNLYSYVQGNPVSYTDPFGLAPENEMSVGSMIAHGVLGIVGMVPGWVGAVANLADAAVYAFVDHDYGMMAVSLVNAFSMGATKYLTGAGKVVTGAGKVVQVGSQATKVSKGVRYAYVISELISNGATFVTAANNTMDVGFHMYEKYEIQGRSYDENIIYEGASLLMNIFTMGMSGNGMIHHGKALGKMIEAENIGGRLKAAFLNQTSSQRNQRLDGGSGIWTRLDTIEDITNYGTNLGKDGQLFLTDSRALEGLDLTKKVDIAKAEQILGLPNGRLTKSTIIVQTEIDVSGLNVRLPSSGNEFFIPGGYTSGGAVEIVVDPLNIFNDSAVKSIRFFHGGNL